MTDDGAVPDADPHGSTDTGASTSALRPESRATGFAIGALCVSVVALGLAAYAVWGPRGGNDTSRVSVPFATGTPVPGDLDWDASLSLPSTSRLGFDPVFTDNPTWSTGTTDAATGSRSYLSADGQCAVVFAEGALPVEVSVTAGDDRRTTGSYLEALDAVTADTVAQFAHDDFLAYGDAFVSVKTLSGTNTDGNNWITAARAFTATGTGISFDLTCAPAVDADAYFYTVVADANVVMG